MSQVSETDRGGTAFSRRTFDNALVGSAAGTFLSIISGVSSYRVVEDRFKDHRSDYAKSVPSDFLTRDLQEWTTKDVNSLLQYGKENRISKPLSLEESSRTGFLEGGGGIPVGKLPEVTFAPVHSKIPTYDTFEVVANGQRRLAAIIATPEPQKTTVQFDPFGTDDFELEITRRSTGLYPLRPEQIQAKVSYIPGEDDCSEDTIAKTMNGMLPWVENVDDVGRAAPFQGFSVLYTIDGMFAVLNVNQMLWEQLGTKVNDLYFDTKKLNGEPYSGRTIDSEWTTLTIFRPDGTKEIKIQRPHHATGWYEGELESGGMRPVVKPVTGNYNFAEASPDEVKSAQFAYRNRILSPEEYWDRRDKPNKYIQWLSLVGLHQSGRVGGKNDSVVKDFLSIYPNLRELPFPQG